jgi:SnoaL-like domain
MTSTDTPLPKFPVSDAVLASLANRDFEGLAMAFEPDVVLSALLPSGFHEWTGPDRVTAAFVRWFGRADEWQLLSTTVGQHGSRLRLGWRARVRGGPFGDGAFVVEQQVYAATGPTGRIQTMALLCSGFTAEHTDV